MQIPHKQFSSQELKNRAFRRAAQVLYEHWEEGTGAHTRLFETLIPESYVLIGRSSKGDSHREHVVPCAWIRDRSIELFEQGKSIDEVARFIETHLKVVKISEEERSLLDFEMGLKTTMPSGWEPGDVMSRLTAAGIVLVSEKSKETL